MSLQLHAMARQPGMARTKVDEELAVGTILTALSGGGVLSGQEVRYSLVSGTGDADNADFSIVGANLCAAQRLNFEAKSVRQFRIRWDWVDSQNSANILSSGERAMTLALANVTTDDEDLDGVPEAEELIAGTNPGDARSVFRVSSLCIEASGAATVRCNVVAGRTYTLQSSTDLRNWIVETDDTATVAASADGTISLIDSDATACRKFYRIAVMQTP